MKKLKLLFSLFFALSLLVFISPQARAANLTVTCDSSDCVTSPASPSTLFNETNWLPGDSVTQTITVDNTANVDSCNLFLRDVVPTGQVPSDFATKLFTSIIRGVTTYFDSTLSALYSTSSISLGVIPAGATEIYSWNVNFDINSDNVYQNAQTVFDFDMVFECGLPSAPPSSGSSVLGAASASVCSDAVPASAPFLTSSATSDNTVLLTWTAVSPVSHYMIRYGTSPGNYVYGAANVGNVTQYTVQGLSGGTTYYFQVAGVNGCQPGPWSNETSPVATGPTLTESVAVGFVEQQLGLSTEATESPSPAVESGEGEVKGLETAPCELPFPWWIPLLFQFAFTAIYLVIRKGQGSVKNVFMVPLVIAILSLIAHLILGCPCENLALIDKLCPWYPLIDLILLFLLLALYQFFLKESRQKS